MAQFVATAPGKLVIAGEYAVLEGAPAIAMAAARRAVVTLNTEAGDHELCIANTGDCFGFEFSAGELHWHTDPGDQGSLFAAAAKTFGSALAGLEPFRVQLCTREFYAGDIKQGLGSSAALAVALSGCLQQALGQASDVDAALALHRDFQGGSGSGIDVSTSYQGGCVAVGDGIRTCHWPEGMHLLPVWTGVAASTPAMLLRLAEFKTAQPRVYGQLQAALATRSAAVLQACDDNDAAILSAALESFAGALREFDEATALGIWSREHNELARLAADAAVGYKPSGAGGGDFGLAFSRDTAALDAFASAAQQAGYRCADFELGVAGLQLG